VRYRIRTLVTLRARRFFALLDTFSPLIFHRAALVTRKRKVSDDIKTRRANVAPANWIVTDRRERLQHGSNNGSTLQTIAYFRNRSPIALQPWVFFRSENWRDGNAETRRRGAATRAGDYYSGASGTGSGK